eukprot:g5420.t1
MEQRFRKRVARLFSSIDLDRDGLVSAAEFHAVLQKMNAAATVEDAKKMLGFGATNSAAAEGLNKDEFEALFNRCLTEHGRGALASQLAFIEATLGLPLFEGNDDDSEELLDGTRKWKRQQNLREFCQSSLASFGVANMELSLRRSYHQTFAALEPRVMRIFKRMDKNEDGCIGWMEFLKVLRKIDPNAGEQTARSTVAIGDIDGDNALSEDEFVDTFRQAFDEVGPDPVSKQLCFLEGVLDLPLSSNDDNVIHHHHHHGGERGETIRVSNGISSTSSKRNGEKEKKLKLSDEKQVAVLELSPLEGLAPLHERQKLRKKDRRKEFAKQKKTSIEKWYHSPISAQNLCTYGSSVGFHLDMKSVEATFEFADINSYESSKLPIEIQEPWRNEWQQKLWFGSKGAKAEGELRVLDRDGFRRRAGCVVFETKERKRVLCVRGAYKKKNKRNQQSKSKLSNGNQSKLSKKYEDMKWVFPAGGVEVGESMVLAAIRELEEEAGYRVKKENLIHARSLGWCEDPAKKSRTIYFAVYDAEDVGSTSPSYDGRERRFFDVEDALDVLKPIFFEPLRLALD